MANYIPDVPPSNTATFGHPWKSYLTSHFSIEIHISYGQCTSNEKTLQTFLMLYYEDCEVCLSVWLLQSGKGQWFTLKQEVHVTQPYMVQSAPNFAHLIIVLKMSTRQYNVKVNMKLHFSLLLKTAPVGFLLKGVTVVWWQISMFLQETGSCCNSTVHGQHCPRLHIWLESRPHVNIHLQSECCRVATEIFLLFSVLSLAGWSDFFRKTLQPWCCEHCVFSLDAIAVALCLSPWKRKLL